MLSKWLLYGASKWQKWRPKPTLGRDTRIEVATARNFRMLRNKCDKHKYRILHLRFGDVLVIRHTRWPFPISFCDSMTASRSSIQSYSISLKLETMEDGMAPKRSRIHSHSVCMRSPWPCRLLQFGSPHYYRGWGSQGYYSVLPLCNEWIWYQLLQCFLLSFNWTTMKKRLPFCCLSDAMCQCYGPFWSLAPKTGAFLSMQIVSQLFLFSHSVFQSWRLKPRGLKDSSQDGCQRCESDKHLILGMRELASIYIIPCTSPRSQFYWRLCFYHCGSKFCILSLCL